MGKRNKRGIGTKSINQSIVVLIKTLTSSFRIENLLLVTLRFHLGVIYINLFQPPSLEFQIETSHLICRVNEINCFCMKCNTRPKWFNPSTWSTSANYTKLVLKITEFDRITVKICKIYIFVICWSYKTTVKKNFREYRVQRQYRQHFVL